MYKTYTKAGYSITEDPIFRYKEWGIDDKLKTRMEYLYEESQNRRNKKIISELEQLISLYPKAPIFKNFLSTAYQVRGNMPKALEISEEIIDSQGYLYGRLMIAQVFLEQGNIDKISILLGPDLDIRKLFPERDVFHLAEVSAILAFSVKYYIVTAQVDKAKKRLEELNEVNPLHPLIEKLDELLPIAELKKVFDTMKDSLQQERISKPLKAQSKKTLPPDFQHKEINKLYRYDSSIPQTIIKDILKLPRASLIADLEKVLDDCIDRYDYFQKSEENDFSLLFFPIHAILLLTELKAKESLSKVLHVLSYEETFLNFWFGDFITEEIWLYFYQAGIENRDELIDFICNANVFLYAKSGVRKGLQQIALLHPNQKDKVQSIYTEIFDYFLSLSPEEAKKSNDPELTAQLINDTALLHFKELLPRIKELFDRGYVSIGFNGDYTNTVKYMDSDIDFKDKIKNIYALYTNEASDLEDEWMDDYFTPQSPITVTKTGRNDPCPCGSGKKYKKCCGKS